MKRKLAILMVLIMAMSGLVVGLSGCGRDKDALYIYNFGDYIDPDLVKDFQKETGIKVIYGTFDTNEELYPVIRNRTADYDLICASDYMLEKMVKEDMLDKIDYSNVPNRENILPEYREKVATFDKGEEHVVPHTWGTMGIIYNTDVIPKGSISSWNDLWKKDYSGKIVMPDSMRDTMAIALKAKRYSLNSLSKDQIKEAADYLKEQKPLVYKYANDSARDLLTGGSADIGVIWNGEYIYSKDLKPSLEFVVPSEGSEEFIDGWAIPKGAKNKEAAEKWINFMLSKEASLKNFDYLYYTIPNKFVKEEGNPDFVKNPVVFPGAEVIGRCEALKDLGHDGDDLYTEFWKKFKAD